MHFWFFWHAPIKISFLTYSTYLSISHGNYYTVVKKINSCVILHFLNCQTQSNVSIKEEVDHLTNQLVVSKSWLHSALKTLFFTINAIEWKEPIPSIFMINTTFFCSRILYTWYLPISIIQCSKKPQVIGMSPFAL